MQQIYSTFIDSLSFAPDAVHLSAEDLQITHSTYSGLGKIYYYATNIFKFAITGTIIAGYGAIYLGYSLITHPYISAKRYFKSDEKDPDVDYQASTFKSVKTTIAKYLPDLFGYSTSTFQDCGLGTDFSHPLFLGRSNWHSWLSPEHIKGIKEEEDFNRFFINYLDNPQKLVDALKAQGITSFRLSLERSVIQPTADGLYDENAIAGYKRLLHALIENGIEPLVTLHHFVDPDWFQESGRFNDEKNIEDFVQYSLDMMDRFDNEVSHWMTFNEPSIYVFQTYIRKVYPTDAADSITMAGNVLRNMLIAHMRIYKLAKAKYGDRKQIGFTHQWLKFVPFNENNPIERIACQFLSHITYKAVYDFFKPSEDGVHRFSFNFPGVCHTELEVTDEDGSGFMDFTGVQHYGYPVMKMGLNYGENFPGSTDAVTNLTIPWLKCGLTFGATNFENGSVTSFGPPYSPETLMDALEEAAALNKPVIITETGFDRLVYYEGEKIVQLDEIIQAKAYEAIMIIAALTKSDIRDRHNLIQRLRVLINNYDQSFVSRIYDFCDAQIDLIGLQFWTFLSRQIEWENGDGVNLSITKKIAIAFDSHEIISDVETALAGDLVRKVALTKSQIAQAASEEEGTA